jgi:hypothetical protein
MTQDYEKFLVRSKHSVVIHIWYVFKINSTFSTEWKTKILKNVIYVLFKALHNYQVKSKLVWDCQQSLAKLAEYSRVQQAWVPGHSNIEGNETADQLTRLRSECSFIGSEQGLPRRLSGTGQTETTKNGGSP